MGRTPCCDRVGLKKGPWTADEDEKLAAYVSAHGHGSWRALPKKAGLLRCGKSCRLRWTNYLRPDIKRGEFTALEEQTMIQLHALLGNRWSSIAAHLPRRTDNEIKNYWNTHLKKRLVHMGLDPTTHKPKAASPMRNSESPNAGGISGSSSSSSCSHVAGGNSSLLVTHMAQWESARLEAEARLARESALRAKGLWRPAGTNLTLRQSNCKPVPTILVCDQQASSSSQSLLDILPPKQDIGGSMSPASSRHEINDGRRDIKTALTSIELVNSLQNWENSLQGQAGLMWPKSWRLSSRSSPAATTTTTTCQYTAADQLELMQAGQQAAESNSCTSSAGGRALQAEQAAMSIHDQSPSPTSSLCSFDNVSIAPSRVVSSEAPVTSTRKLSWGTDTSLQRANKSCHAPGTARGWSKDTAGRSSQPSYAPQIDISVQSKVDIQYIGSGSEPQSLPSTFIQFGCGNLEALSAKAGVESGSDIMKDEAEIRRMRAVNCASNTSSQQLAANIDHDLELTSQYIEDVSSSERSSLLQMNLTEDGQLLDHYWDNLLLVTDSPTQLMDTHETIFL